VCNFALAPSVSPNVDAVITLIYLLKPMKRNLVILICLLCAGVLTASAAEQEKKPQPTAEQKALRKEMREKYDTNKDGKLDKEERAKMSKEDKDKVSKAFPKKKQQKKKTESTSEQ
jgi:hypothetical protein